MADLSLVESAIARPYNGYYRPINRKVAALLQSVATNHGFIDGNKRTALLLANLLIESSGYRLMLRCEKEFDDIIVAVVSKEISLEGLVAWLKPRLVKA